MLAFTTLAVSAALATSVLASSHDMGHRQAHQGRLKLDKLKANLGKRQGVVPAGALLLTVANSSESINFASMMAGSTPVNTTTPTYNSTALWFSQTAGKMGACLNISTDADMIIGVSTAFWNNTGVPSALCGEKVFVSNGDRNITATLLDASGSNFTTLTIAAFQALGGNLDAGMMPIQFHFLNTSSSLLPNSTTSTTTLNRALVAPAPESAPAPASASLTALPVVADNPNGIPITPIQAAQSSSTTPAPNAAAVAAAAAAASSSASAASKASADAAFASSSSAAAAAASSKAAADRQWASQQAASSSAAAAAASQNAAAQVQANARTAAAAAVAPVAAAASRVYTGGHGTFFYQNGIAGACGRVNQDWSRVIAIDQRMYDGGKNCGRSILVTRTDNGRQVTAVVADMCPTCDNETSLDFSVGAFDALGSQSEGLIPISWQFV